ncbi:hypothetical protein CANARDRAFT_193904 [[Candida] arabinofermentans NRRL YB-2248]|uniref:Phosphatidylinositol 3-kinase VPS34 n=1 Tax=[Candida] arabinofermentans NRRL YB-2248 TaxID=983967 RepID=A0A1E4T8K5_9ASCO|nr:hypothetical protein CANARDRAFT_193904 [[Candida] arabinofermentans NRRL YB-2248]
MNYDTRTQNSISFCLSKDLKLPFRFKILNVNGFTQRLSSFKSELSHKRSATSSIILSNLEEQVFYEVFVLIHIESTGKQLTVPILTSIKYYNKNNNNSNSNGSGVNQQSQYERYESNRSEWVNLPIDYCQLPLDSKLVMQFYNYSLKDGSVITIGDCKLNLFNQETDCTLNKGYQKVKINFRGDDAEQIKITKPGQMQILEEKLKLKESGFNNSIDWLDQMSYRKIEQINIKESLKQKQENMAFDKTGDVFISLELAQFEIPIVFSDSKYATLSITTSESHSLNAVAANNNINNRDQVVFNDITSSNLKALKSNYKPNIFDPDQYRSEIIEDPIEYKFRRLERTHQSSSLDKEIKPTLKIRNELNKILRKQFFEKLSQKEKNMIWKFRFFLLNTLLLNKNTLQFNNFIINFIKCIDWEDDFEVSEFLKIINDLDANNNKGTNLFIKELEIVDCLELLGANYKNHIVRNMAIERLKLASDEDLDMYMVQLVQCIKNEANYINPHSYMDDDIFDESGRSTSMNDDDSDIYDFEDSTYTTNSSDYQVIDIVEDDDPLLRFLNNPALLNPNSQKKLLDKLPNLNSPLANFLIERACCNAHTTNYFYWNLKVEVDEERANNKVNNGFDGLRQMNNVDNADFPQDQQDQLQQEQIYRKHINNMRHIFQKTLIHFIANLALSRNGVEKITTLRNQVDLVLKIHNISMKIKKDYKKETTPRKIEILKQLLVEKHKKSIGGAARKSMMTPTENESLLSFTPVPLPLDPKIQVHGTIPEDSSVFKSSLNPLKITFKTSDDSIYPVMYKIGDDLRQDQFVIQIITLMEKILQNENLDLKLIPYKIMALGPVEGFIQFIPNSSLSSILQKTNSILSYLQFHNPDSSAPHGVKPEVMDNYVRSCAGFCVITYILGVGDRHLENLLLTKDGYFFHADFGYILGQDPKPFPPLMKLPIQIIEGMGGLNDANYKKFCNYCFITYITLRKNSSLILNLFQLMIDSSIPVLRTSNLNGISNETEKLELIWKIEEKFMLELDDEEAVLHFHNLINDSVNAFLPVVIDRLHSLAQYWRA